MKPDDKSKRPANPPRPPTARPRNTAHDLPRKTIFMIVGVAAAGIAIGMFLIMPHYGPREPRRPLPPRARATPPMTSRAKPFS